jgi:hypothetical protein
VNQHEPGLGTDKGGEVDREALEGQAGDPLVRVTRTCVPFSLLPRAPRGRQRKGHRPYPPLGAAAPRARGRDEVASAGSRRRTRSRRQGGARAGTGPAGQRPGPQEAPGRLQPVRVGRREMLPGGFMAHRSRAPVRVTRERAGLGCGAAAGGAGHAGWARMLRPRAGVRGWGLGDGGAPSSALSAFPGAARREGSPPLHQLGASSSGCTLPVAGAAAPVTAGVAAGPKDAEEARAGASGTGTRGAGARLGDAQRGTAPHPPGARPNGVSGADADALADADAVACMGRAAHARLWEPWGGGGQSDAASQAASK